MVQSMNSSDLKPARLAFDMGDETFPGYVSRKNWNGFADAYFEADAWARVIQWIDSVDPDLAADMKSQQPASDGLYSLGLGYSISEV